MAGPEFPSNARDYYNKRKSSLELERQSFIPHWKELSQFVKPRRGRFFISDRNKGEKRHQSIINSRATQAHRVATSGLLAGTMSPTRPWFALETYDHELMERSDVKQWLYTTEEILRRVFNESNFYGMASTICDELLLFGTGCMSHVDDFNDVARFYTHTSGSYMIGQNDRFEIDTLFREFEWTVLQIVRKFGLENCSTPVRTAYDRSEYDKWFPVCHIIEPNDNYKEHSARAEHKRFRSVYYEPQSGQNVDHNKYLSVKGFDEFPAYVPRWETTGEDIYGTNCPGMTALGDVKSLQIEEKRKAQGIDKMVNPPLAGPPSLRNSPVNSLAGGLTIYEGLQANELRPIYTVAPQLGELRADIDAVERRIEEAFFVDLFLAISNMEGIQPRNQLDIIQRNEERLLQLGPVLEHLQGEFLDKLIDRTFNQCVRANILPPPPESMQGEPLRVKYISTLAMAQRAVATQGIDRLAAFVGGLVGAGFTDAALKFDSQQAVDEYAKAIGVPPSLIVPDETVAQVEEQVEREAQAEKALAAAGQMANTAKMASDAKTNDKSVLTDLGA
jgi:hypothetical protein